MATQTSEFTAAEEGRVGWLVLLLLVLCMPRDQSCASGCCSGCRQPLELSQDGYAFVASQSIDQQALADAEAVVNELVTACITQTQFDALVDYAYQVGPYAFAESDVLQSVNACAYDTAAQQMAYGGERAAACYFTQQATPGGPQGCALS